MTESEAIKEFQQNIQLPFGSSISDEASKLAIKALEKQEKIKKVLNTVCLSDDVSKCYYDGDCSRHEYSEIIKILRSDEQ